MTGLLAAVALFALGLSVLVSAAMARRFTTPLRRLTEASRGLAEGDLTRRVPAAEVRAGSSELAELAVQFNAMADRLEESVEIIRRDRDRSRDFLADVSHELRTPLAALRTFNELLKEGAGDDPEARAEFLESSGQQIERLDWLAQNLLELSKLDSGLVLLDLRPDDLRAAVESAVEQSQRPPPRGAACACRSTCPTAPIRIRHDPQRIGQVVANLVGQRGQVHAARRVGRGRRRRHAGRRPDRGRRHGRRHRRRPSCRTSSSGSTAARGPTRRAAAAAASGWRSSSSIVDMHGGTVEVESRVGGGIAVHRHAAARPAPGRGHAGRRSGPPWPRRPTAAR